MTAKNSRILVAVIAALLVAILAGVFVNIAPKPALSLTLIAPEEIAYIAKAIPSMKIEFVERSGHLPHYERAETVNPIITDFSIRSQNA